MSRFALTSTVALALSACLGAKPPAPTVTVKPVVRAKTGAEALLAVIPAGAQVVVELDLARLRNNPVVGDVVKAALAQAALDARLPGLPLEVQGTPLATADALVIAAYGVGTVHAAAITVVATKDDVPGATRVSPTLVALGPEDWVGQVQARAKISGAAPEAELMTLRQHAMPEGATGAVLRVTARLSFDARIALARQLGIDAAPAQLSLWGDVADDLALIVDANAIDPGDHGSKDAAKRLAHTIRGMLSSAADTEVVRSLGVPTSLSNARIVAGGTWVRAIIEVTPRHLARVVERAKSLLGGSS